MKKIAKFNSCHSKFSHQNSNFVHKLITTIVELNFASQKSKTSTVNSCNYYNNYNCWCLGLVGSWIQTFAFSFHQNTTPALSTARTSKKESEAKYMSGPGVKYVARIRGLFWVWGPHRTKPKFSRKNSVTLKPLRRHQNSVTLKLLDAIQIQWLPYSTVKLLTPSTSAPALLFWLQSVDTSSLQAPRKQQTKTCVPHCTTLFGFL
jgi:Flp pilus assembly protein TadG